MLRSLVKELFINISPTTTTSLVWPDIALGGLLRISSDGDDRMGAKIKTQKNPKGFQQNPKKSLDPKLTPKKSHAEFPSLKNFQKALNDMPRKIKPLEHYAEWQRGRNTRALPRIFSLFWIPKNSLLKLSHRKKKKKYLPNYPTQKNPGIKNLKPKKILRSCPSLVIWRTTPWGHCLDTRFKRSCIHSIAKTLTPKKNKPWTMGSVLKSALVGQLDTLRNAWIVSIIHHVRQILVINRRTRINVMEINLVHLYP